MVFINSNRSIQCKNTLGGVKNAYLAPYKKVLRSQIIYDGKELTQFPQTFIYKFELVNGGFEQSQEESDGGKFYNQRITLNFNKISIFDNINFSKLLRKDYFLVLEDRNGNFFLMGFRNGASCDKLDVNLTSYTLTFEAKEEEFAPYCSSLIGTDLVPVDYENHVFENDDNYIFENDDNYIWH